jgi:hypothetical protein
MYLLPKLGEQREMEYQWLLEGERSQSRMAHISRLMQRLVDIEEVTNRVNMGVGLIGRTTRTRKSSNKCHTTPS